MSLKSCNKAPAGWYCTRGHGHPGPCAAEPIPEGVLRPEKSGGPTSYYLCDVVRPNQGKVPYQAECGDIIEALGMNFNEGCAFKAIWRTAAARTLGKLKEGGDARYDAQKVQFYGGRMLAQFEPPLGDSGVLGGVVIGPQPTLNDAKDIMQYMVDNAPGFREFLETLQKPV